jgi:Mg2+ and Co2+ transporter CorA
VSRYSFVALTGSFYGKNILLPHMQTMYFQMFSLLLAYHATIIKFSDEIQDITSQSDGISSKTRRLYKKYLNFLNKLYFKEITAQDQGIELYNKAMKIMDIDRYMKDLDNEINELHNYADMVAEKSRNEKLDALTYIGAIFLPLSVITGFFGMNVGSADNFSSGAVAVGILVSISIGIFMIVKSKKVHKLISQWTKDKNE